MNFDYITLSGKNHLICEDYSTSFESKEVSENGIIICDGCSSSKNSDYGSRLLSQILKSYYHQLIKFNSNSNINEHIINLNDSLIFKCKKILETLNMDCSIFDSTIVTAYKASDNDISIYMKGDGVIFWKSKSKNLLNYIDVDFKNINENFDINNELNNAPCYFSYLLDSKRLKNYIEKSNNCIMDIKFYPDTLLSYTENITGYNYFFKNFNMSDISFIGIASDGIKQIKSKSTGESIQILDVLTEFTSFKSLLGEFIKKRVKRAVSDYEKNNFHLTDDLSIGVILNED